METEEPSPLVDLCVLPDDCIITGVDACVRDGDGADVMTDSEVNGMFTAVVLRSLGNGSLKLNMGELADIFAVMDAADDMLAAVTLADIAVLE